MVRFEHSVVRLPSLPGAEHVAFEETRAMQRVVRPCICFRSACRRCSRRVVRSRHREVRPRASMRKNLRRGLASRPCHHAGRFVSRAGSDMPRAIGTDAIFLTRLMFCRDLLDVLNARPRVTP